MMKRRHVLGCRAALGAGLFTALTGSAQTISRPASSSIDASPREGK
jgi:hypothetical protein